jgi:hypothetical protein
MNQGKLPVLIVPVVSAVLVALAATSVFVPGGWVGIALATVLGLLGLVGLLLWWKVLRNPEVMVQKLLERRGALSQKAGIAGVDGLEGLDLEGLDLSGIDLSKLDLSGIDLKNLKLPDHIDASEEDIQKAVDAATAILGGNRAARRAAEAAARKAVTPDGISAPVTHAAKPVTKPTKNKGRSGNGSGGRVTPKGGA